MHAPLFICSEMIPTEQFDAIIIGGGAAGFFGAIHYKRERPADRVVILEQSAQLLSKVRISGGGRCNVTHACFEPKLLIANYPRGSKEMLGPFFQFGPKDTVSFFEELGVKIKTESDGRMFPVSDSSESITGALMREASRLGVEIHISSKVQKISHSENDGMYTITTPKSVYLTRKCLFAAGSSNSCWKILEDLQVGIIEPVPSLFTFNINDKSLQSLAGISVPEASIAVRNEKLQTSGPLLITHWGISGPAVLKMSAFGARIFHTCGYQFSLQVDWLPGISFPSYEAIKQTALKKLSNYCPFDSLPARLWLWFLEKSGISPDKRYADLSKQEYHALQQWIKNAVFHVNGKSTFKEEFVTAGGVDLKEIDFKRFEHKRVKGLYLAGEILDIDGVTGGFNFQAAWTGGYIAGRSMAAD
jgi:predicted Rossmann fold flavoprotein